MRKQPCKDCKKRYLGCHSICPDYKEMVEENKKISEKRSKVVEQKQFWYSCTKKVRQMGKK